MGNSRGLEFDPHGLRTEEAKPPIVRRIAVADDTPQDLEVIQEILRGPNVEIFPATGSGELLRVLGKHRPLDLVVTDIDMPGLEGLSVVSLARAEGMETPVLFVTGALTRSGLETRVARIRNSRLLHKPIDALALRLAALEMIGDPSLKWE